MLRRALRRVPSLLMRCVLHALLRLQQRIVVVLA